MDNDLLDTSDQVTLDCLRYCFMEIIRNDLKSIKNDWNNYLISKSRNGGLSGRPNCMFFLPHLYDSENFLAPLDKEGINEFHPILYHDLKDYSDEFAELVRILCDNDENWHIQYPKTPEEGLHTYLFLLEKIYEFS